MRIDIGVIKDGLIHARVPGRNGPITFTLPCSDAIDVDVLTERLIVAARKALVEDLAETRAQALIALLPPIDLSELPAAPTMTEVHYDRSGMLTLSVAPGAQVIVRGLEKKAGRPEAFAHRRLTANKKGQVSIHLPHLPPTLELIPVSRDGIEGASMTLTLPVI